MQFLLFGIISAVLISIVTCHGGLRNDCRKRIGTQICPPTDCCRLMTGMRSGRAQCQSAGGFWDNYNMARTDYNDRCGKGAYCLTDAECAPKSTCVGQVCPPAGLCAKWGQCQVTVRTTPTKAPTTATTKKPIHPCDQTKPVCPTAGTAQCVKGTGLAFTCKCKVNFYGDTCQKTCGGFFNVPAAGQAFKSPEFPSNYPNGVTCTWNLTGMKPANTVKVTFKKADFAIEAGGIPCQYDGLEIFKANSAADATKKFGRYCGTLTSDLVLASTGRDMFLSFTSDGSVSAKGFQFTAINV